MKQTKKANICQERQNGPARTTYCSDMVPLSFHQRPSISPVRTRTRMCQRSLVVAAFGR
jgi:hypothetical protein